MLEWLIGPLVHSERPEMLRNMDAQDQADKAYRDGWSLDQINQMGLPCPRQVLRTADSASVRSES